MYIISVCVCVRVKLNKIVNADAEYKIQTGVLFRDVLR